MTTVITHAKAAWSFVKTLLGPQDRIAHTDRRGITRLEGWERLPESAAQAIADNPHNPLPGCQAVLYCFDGPHAGEIFPLSGPRVRIGQNANDDVVLTPSSPGEMGNYELMLGPCCELRSQAPYAFEVNGRPGYQCVVVDYDELSLCGNRFLFLQNQEEPI